MHTSGNNKGALGDGWYKKTINLTPYTISTATTGSCAFVELDVIARNSSLQTIATDGAQMSIGVLTGLTSTTVLQFISNDVWSCGGAVC